MDKVAYLSVLQFWFQESSPAQWWKVDAEFDRLIVERFSELHGRATRSELFEWRAEPRGRLAEIIVLDQFSRNMHRGDALAYANDTLALALAQEAVAAKADRTLAPEERVFMYMPYMHSESRRHPRGGGATVQGMRPEEQLRLRASTQGDHRPLWSLPASQRHARASIHGGRARIPCSTWIEFLKARQSCSTAAGSVNSGGVLPNRTRKRSPSISGGLSA